MDAATPRQANAALAWSTTAWGAGSRRLRSMRTASRISSMALGPPAGRHDLAQELVLSSIISCPISSINRRNCSRQRPRAGPDTADGQAEVVGQHLVRHRRVLGRGGATVPGTAPAARPERIAP